MAQLNDSELLALALSGLVQIRRDALVSALVEVLEKHPALLTGAVAKVQSPQPSDATLPTPTKRWPSDAASFGALLRERRTSAGLTRDELSSLSRVAPSTIRNIEVKRHRPTLRTRCLIIQAFDRLPVFETTAPATAFVRIAPTSELMKDAQSTPRDITRSDCDIAVRSHGAGRDIAQTSR